MEERKPKSAGRKMNPVLKHLLFAVAVVILLIFASAGLMSLFTRHNSEMDAPDLTGMPFVQARGMAEEYGLEAIVKDSVYVRSVPGGFVINQDPLPGGKVKSGRRMRLTVNAICKKPVSMPNLIGMSLRSAAAELSSRGLDIEKLVYVSDMATNVVLKQKYRGTDAAPGKSVPGDAVITLVLGLNGNDCTTRVPDLTGVSYGQVRDKLYDCSLNVGAMIFENAPKTYMDSINSVVISQKPASPGATLRRGASVSLRLSAPEKMNDDPKQ